MGKGSHRKTPTQHHTRRIYQEPIEDLNRKNLKGSVFKLKIILSIVIIYLLLGIIFSLAYYRRLLSSEIANLTSLGKISMAVVITILWLLILFEQDLY